MELEEILASLSVNTGVFPREALKAAIADPARITPYLLEALDLEWAASDNAYMLHLYAMYLLAQFREQRAYRPIVDFFSVPGDAALDATGDFVTEDLGRTLASVCGGDMSLMRALVENPQANEYVRSAALRGMVCLVAQDIVPRDEVMAYFVSLFRGGLERQYTYTWNALTSCSCDLYPEEVFGDIQAAMDEGLVDEMSIDLGYVEESLARKKSSALMALRLGYEYRPIDDTIAEMEWWACFKHEPRRRSEDIDGKVGRNAPCPCGSGRKYKYCCGRRT